MNKEIVTVYYKWVRKTKREAILAECLSIEKIEIRNLKPEKQAVRIS